MLISPRLLPFLASCLYHFCFETRVSRNPVNIYISSTFGEGRVDKLGEIPEISQIPFVYLVQTALYYSFSLSLLFLSLCTPCPIYCILHLGFYSFLDSYCVIRSETKKKCVRVKGEKGERKSPDEILCLVVDYFSCTNNWDECKLSRELLLGVSNTHLLCRTMSGV